MGSTTKRGGEGKKDWYHVSKHGRNGQRIISNYPTEVICLKKTMLNEGIEIIRIAEVNSNWSKIPIIDNLYNSTDEWFKTSRISTGYNRGTISDGKFQSVGTTILVVG